MQAVILAGGKGTRLAELLNGKPKPLVDVCGVPLLERQLRSLEEHGVTEAILLVNHAADQIESFARARVGNIKVTTKDDGKPRGTAGAVLAQLDQLAERFLVVYGDTLFDIDLGHLIEAHEVAGAAATLLLHPNDHPADSDLVEVDGVGFISAFHAYPHPPGAELPNLVNAAFYVVERDALIRWRDEPAPIDFAKELFPRMLDAGDRLYGYRSGEYIKDLGTVVRLRKAERHLASGLVARSRRGTPQKAVFIDRDGTLNALRDYVRSPADLELLPGAGEAVRRLNEAECRAIVVTNQPVLARGECDDATMARIHMRLDMLLGEHGAYVDGLFLCPHHPHGGFPGEVAALKMQCDCRKPGTGLIDQAVAQFNIDPSRSWLIGDSTSDMLAARRAGLQAVLVRTGERGADGRCPGTPDFEVDDIAAAVRLITEGLGRMVERLSPALAQIGPGALVLVGGLARSGKTGAASVLRSMLAAKGLSAQSLSLDRWIRPENDRGAGLLGRYALDDAEIALVTWLSGNGVTLTPPFYDRFRRWTDVGDPIDLAADSVLILEGVPALLRDWTTSRSTTTIFVDAAEDARAKRVIADLELRGLAGPEVARATYEGRQADEAPLVRASRERAKHVVEFDGIHGFSA